MKDGLPAIQSAPCGLTTDECAKKYEKHCKKTIEAARLAGLDTSKFCTNMLLAAFAVHESKGRTTSKSMEA